MPTVYERAYGAVKFYKLNGTMLFDSEDDFGFWTSKDTEPSPDVKWVRVSVPGADGAVDLSRALAGQVTYEQREIELQFVGKFDDHEVAVDTLMTMRSFLHGARVRIVTVHTRHYGGYYIADCECDGEVRLDGTVVIDVLAHAEPFIHVGTQSLALPASTATTETPVITKLLVMATILGVVRLSVVMDSGQGGGTPKGTRSGKLWYARNDNLFDLSYHSVVGYHADGQGTYVYDSNARASGQEIRTGAIGTYSYKYVYVTALKRTGTILDSNYCGSIPFVGGFGSYSSANYVGVYITGTIDSVDSPSIDLSRYYSVSATDGRGRPTTGRSGYTSITFATALAAGTYDDTYVGRFALSDLEQIHALCLEIGGLVTSGLRIRLAVQQGSVFPAHWQAPQLGYLPIDFGGTFCRAPGAADTAEITRMGVKTTHNCALTSSGYNGYALSAPYVTEGSIDGWFPEDADYACLTLTNSFGEDCAACAIGLTKYTVKHASGSNGTMRSTPAVTSDNGVYLKIDGAGDAVFVPGGTHELSELTIGGGVFQVEYATLGGGAAALTWEGGVL